MTQPPQNPPPPGGQQWNPPPPPGYYPPPYQTAKQTNPMAVAALVGALVVAPLGIVFGHIALSQIRRTGEEGRPLAIAGLVIGYVLTAVFAVFIVFWIVAMVWFAHEMSTIPTTYPSYGNYTIPTTP